MLITPSLYNKLRFSRTFLFYNRRGFDDTRAISSSIIYPGSFNPFHLGHRAILEYIKNNNSLNPYDCFIELSIANFDKPNVTIDSLNERIDGILNNCSDLIDGIIISNAATFKEKCDIYKNCSFAVGMDTYDRIQHPQNYKCGFLVFQRGTKKNIDNYSNVMLMDGFDGVNISSTEIRKSKNEKNNN